MADFIFIVGTGRSGTHLLGRSLGSHPQISARIESPTTFRLLTQVASQQDWRNGAYLNVKRWFLILIYKYLRNRADTRYILEKTHPSLWMVEFLLERFPESKFIAVWRDVEPTVASMLKHKGVMSWYRRLPQDRINRFLGITAANVGEFNQFSLEKKCALRWLSHMQEIERLQEKFPQSVTSVRYDDFCLDQNRYLEQIAEFVGLTSSFKVEDIRVESLEKWKTQLTCDQAVIIRSAVQVT